MWTVGSFVESWGKLKQFYTQENDRLGPESLPSGQTVSTQPPPALPSPARIAVYDTCAAAPRIEEVPSAPTREYIERLSSRIYELVREAGGTVPYTVVREVAENLIHADFSEPVVSIMDGGMTVRIADQGPGIADKRRALEPGFTTARGTMKRYIRGVGSGLPIVKEFLSHGGGSLVLEDNLGTGAVVTIMTRRPEPAGQQALAGGISLPLQAGERPVLPNAGYPSSFPEIDSIAQNPRASRLNSRQKQVLALVVDSREAGPSLIAKQLGVGVSTAYRDLSSLEDMGLIKATEAGKRAVTDLGLSCLSKLMLG